MEPQQPIIFSISGRHATVRSRSASEHFDLIGDYRRMTSFRQVAEANNAVFI
jgi:hypothetical protein